MTSLEQKSGKSTSKKILALSLFFHEIHLTILGHNFHWTFLVDNITQGSECQSVFSEPSHCFHGPKP